MVTCPICKDEFKDLRGLNGHLRFKHDLEGEELDRVYGKAKEEQREEQEMRRAPSMSDLRILIGEELSRRDLGLLRGIQSEGLDGVLGDRKLTRLLDAYALVLLRKWALSKAMPTLYSGSKWKWGEIEEQLEDQRDELYDKLKEAMRKNA